MSETIHLARLKKEGTSFELDIDPDLAMEYKKGGETELASVLKAEEVFVDAKKGLQASDQELMKAFKTTDFETIAKEILENGEIQLTEEYRQAQREEKLKKILAMIHRDGVDPKTKLPHPETRIKNAFEEVNVKLDEHKTAEEQLDDVIKQLRTVLPISFVRKHISIKLPAEYAAKSYSLLHSFGKLIKEDWLNDGSLLAVLDIPGGLEQDLYDKLNNFSHGSVECNVIKTE